MIVYSKKRADFTKDVLNNNIEDIILNAIKRSGVSVAENEVRSWRNSLPRMNDVLQLAQTPEDAGVSIEYRIPLSSKRIDFILSGRNEENREIVVIVELKQWEKAKRTPKDGIVSTTINRSEREVTHPSYQAWTYARLLEDYNATVQDESISLTPCAYLHNCISDNDINHAFYSNYTEKAPSFLKHEAKDLANFIKKFVVHGDSNDIMYRIENGKIRPSKNLADSLVSLLDGNQEFVMIEEQKHVYETALYYLETIKENQKQVLIVEGGPGTGKSVVAVNLLVEFTKRGNTVQYVTKNSAPRTVYESRLTGKYTKSHISNLFKGSGGYHSVDPNVFDVLLVDEAHRLNEKSGMFQNKGENQIKEIMEASRLSVFFVDDDQMVTFKDIGNKESIVNWAKSLGIPYSVLNLSSQFRCNGSEAYLAWLDNSLQIRGTANTEIDDLNYEFGVLDSPKDLKDLIIRKNLKNNKSRMVAGYCWDWISKKADRQTEKDIVIDEYNFAMQWNLSNDGMLWIEKPDSVEQIGCIHTCQGLELDYIGVIIGPDLLYRNGKLITAPDNRAKTDQSLKGYKKLLKSNPEYAEEKADRIIRNTYKTLMTRGQKGCYIFCTDKQTNEYFKELVLSASAHREEPQTVASAIEHSKYPGLELTVLESDKVDPYVNSVPIYNLHIAAGNFSEYQIMEEFDWVELPDHIAPHQDYFVAQVVGESMNKKIPNGTWCLFRKNPAGTRNNQIVIAQHHSIYDEDHRGQYTIKRYYSEKQASDNGEWRHSKIILKPESNLSGYEDIELTEESAQEMSILAVYVCNL